MAEGAGFPRDWENRKGGKNRLLATGGGSRGGEQDMLYESTDWG